MKWVLWVWNGGSGMVVLELCGMSVIHDHECHDDDADADGDGDGDHDQHHGHNNYGIVLWNVYCV